jgi:4-amino-4-deoxy-L-arabinose transferase-like glycosyltransferase
MGLLHGICPVHLFATIAARRPKQRYRNRRSLAAQTPVPGDGAPEGIVSSPGCRGDDLNEQKFDGSVGMASRSRLWPHLGLTGILVLALALRGWRLGAGGFITPYYMAGVRSMMASWHNFFFNAFDPTGFVSLDKPPLAFWIQTGSAELFGFSPFSVLLPQVLEGSASILVLYHLVRRVFGTAAGLLAALFLALTPIAVAVDRSNNTEPVLVLTLLLAAWALSRSIETGRLWFLLLSAALVGIAFNVKMLVAFGVVPIFTLIYLARAPILLPRRIGYLAAAAGVLATVSLAWTGVYDLTPPENRPFVDSTSGNSMFELIVGENFIRRFVPRGDRLRQTLAAAANPNPTPDQTAARLLGRDYVPAGPTRLVAPHLAAQTGWLFPLSLIGGVAAWWRYRRRPGNERLQLALWAGWALTYGIVFSAAAGLFHGYYLVAMAPALCALAGIGTVSLWSLYAAGGAGSLLLPATFAATALWQGYIVNGYLNEYSTIGEKWLVPIVIGIAGLIVAGLVALRGVQPRVSGAVALALLVGMPTAWSIGTVLVKGNTGFPAARPPFLNDAAETQRRRWSMVAGALGGDPKLIDFLRSNHNSEAYLLASINARQAAPIIIATGDPVIALGGFTGRDPILTVDDFARLVQDHHLRFALIGDGSPGLRRIFGEDGQKPVVDWIRANGRLVDPAKWRAAPGANFEGRSAEGVGAQLYDLRSTGDGR